MSKRMLPAPSVNHETVNLALLPAPSESMDPTAASDEAPMVLRASTFCAHLIAILVWIAAAAGTLTQTPLPVFESAMVPAIISR